VSDKEPADVAQLASLSDETPEGRSIVVLAKDKFGIRGRELHDAHFIPFTAQTRMSGVDMPDGNGGMRLIRKGSADAVKASMEAHGNPFAVSVQDLVDQVARRGGQGPH
jgi:K+-transporting ATPase ATPase B chain